MPSANNESRDSMAGASLKLSEQPRVEGLHIDNLRGLADGLALKASQELADSFARIASPVMSVPRIASVLNIASPIEPILRSSIALEAALAIKPTLTFPNVADMLPLVESLWSIPTVFDIPSPAAPFVKSLRDIEEAIEPLTRTPAVVVALERHIQSQDMPKKLLERGWVPSHTMPFDLIAECGDDSAELEEVLLEYYTDNWPEVRARLERQLSSYRIDDDAKAIFREALDNHEDRRYSSVVNLLLLRFEKMFCTVLFPGRRAGPIRYVKILNELYEMASDMYLGEKYFSYSVDSILFNKYLTKGADKSAASCGVSPNGIYVPGLATRVDHTNIEFVEQNPIPNRNAVAHGWVDYSSQQNSLNAIFIADYVLSVISRISSNTSKSNRRYIK